MNMDRRYRVRVTCAPGLSDLLQEEIKSLGLQSVDTDYTGVNLVITLADAMRLNLYLRTAFSVLILLKHFRCPSPKALYRHAASYAWEELIPADGYLSVESHVDNPKINNTMFANMRLKDAIVDRISEKMGRRPDSGPARTGVVINLYWKKDHAYIYLNTSGRKLADRGYRKIPHKAPMQETLAAGVLLRAGCRPGVPVVNPMCGSGTLAIEAALIVADRPPGLVRLHFGIEHIIGFDRDTWNSLRAEARKKGKGKHNTPIIASDIDPAAVEAARRNARTAGVEHLIEFHTCDFADTPVPRMPGIVILNPEYGKRLGNTDELKNTYKRIGDFFKQKCSHCTGYVFTGSPELGKCVGLKASSRSVFFNSGIECRLLRFDMYSGSRETSTRSAES